jgi:trehalose 6-phosphate phosphatase
VPDDGAGWQRHVDWAPWLGRPGTAGVLTDYDGTLAPVVEDRDKAAPLPGVRGIMSSLAERLAVVAVVSGRPVEYLESQLGLSPKVTLVGLYGLERIENGELRVMDAAVEWEEAVASAATAVARAAPPGLEIEMKRLTLVLHSRRAPETLQWAKQWAVERASSSGMVAQPGRFSVELLPPVRTDKGTVVEELSAALNAVCFFGDDSGDLPAFSALRRLRSAGKTTIAVGVESPEQPDELANAVDLLVSGAEEAVALLRSLAGLGGTPPPPLAEGISRPSTSDD